MAQTNGGAGFEFADEAPPPPRVVRVGEPRAAPPPPRPHEPNRLPERAPATLDALLYPLRGPGLTMLLLATPLLAILRFAALYVPFAWIFVMVFVGGYFGAFYLDILGRTMGDDDRLPDWPALDAWDTLIRTWWLFFRLGLGSFLACLVVLYVGDPEAAWFFPAALVTWAAGCTYLPMAVVAQQALGGMRFALPHVVVPAILRCLPRYLAPIGVLMAAVLALVFADELTSRIPFFGALVAAATSLYALMLEARLAGLIYRENRAALGWDDVSYRQTCSG